jgi:hypothetical protein
LSKDELFASVDVHLRFETHIALIIAALIIAALIVTAG